MRNFAQITGAKNDHHPENCSRVPRDPPSRVDPFAASMLGDRVHAHHGQNAISLSSSAMHIMSNPAVPLSVRTRLADAALLLADAEVLYMVRAKRAIAEKDEQAQQDAIAEINAMRLNFNKLVVETAKHIL